MATNAVNRVIRHLRRTALRQDGAGLTDSALLEQYVTRQDEAAFEALVRRHGPMVLGVCRRVLRNEADAEDAFQATFLVLVRRAASIRSRATVSNWLYGVAHNTALKAKAMNSKRRTKERQAGMMPKAEAAEEVWGEVQALLDTELSRLPDKYRIPIVLCDLEGKSIKEAARQLGWPQGTAATRLARGRALLAKRLAKHGLTLSGGVLTVALSHGTATASVPPALFISTVKAAGLFAMNQAAATGVISVKVAALTEGVLKTMLLTKLRRALLAVLTIGLLGPGAGLLVCWASAGAARQDKPEPTTSFEKARQPEPKDAPALGYRWVMEPQDGRGSPWATGRADGKGVVAIEEKDKDGALLLTLAHPAPTNRAGLVEFRPVAFDDHGKRHVLERIYWAATGEVAMNRFRLDPKKLPAEKVKRLGVEMLTPEGVRLIARQAIARAKKEGVEVLPPAGVGNTYDFVLTTTDGRKVRSADLKGKVVLLDCWSCT